MKVLQAILGGGEGLEGNLKTLNNALVQGTWLVVRFFVERVIIRMELIIETLTGLTEFITGVFTGDWDRAWEGIKTIWAGFWEFAVDLSNLALAYDTRLFCPLRC